MNVRSVVRRHFRTKGRHDLPWRQTTDPYHIVVSEVMLQQTQVVRVVQKYTEFLKKFPTPHALAKAPLAEVLGAWSGLGYNRRAKYLHHMAQTVVREYGGEFPKTYEELRQPPGIGPYTAGAVCAFAFNKPVPIIETNIRTVYLHHFFPTRKKVSDTELLQKIKETLDTKNPRQWYWALMDYGAYLKQSGINTNTKSAHYVPQSRFEGSRRQVRGALMRALLKAPMTTTCLATVLTIQKDVTQTVLDDLVAEGFVKKTKHTYTIV